MKALRYRIKVFRQYEDLIKELVARDIKLRYRRSFLGYVWSILNPLLIMIIMTVVFSAMFKRDIENFPVYLLTGRMTYDFMKNATNFAMKSVTGNAALLKKTYIPKYIFTVAKVTSSLVEFFFSLGALMIVMIFTHAGFHWAMLFLPVTFLELYVFSMGLGFLLAALHVFFRDIQYIYNAVLTAWMYLTPIFYPLESLPRSLQIFISTCNPLYYYVTQFRCCVLDGVLPPAGLVIGGGVIALAMMVIGLLVFERHKDRFILYI